LTVKNCTKVGNGVQEKGFGSYDDGRFVGFFIDKDGNNFATLFAGDPSLQCGYHNITIENNTITQVFQPIAFPTNGPKSNIVVKGNTFTGCVDNHFQASGNFMEGTNVFEDNVIDKMTGRFIRLAGATATSTFTLSNNTVTNPLKYDTGGDGDIVKITGTNGFAVTDAGNNGWDAGTFTATGTWKAMGKSAEVAPTAETTVYWNQTTTWKDGVVPTSDAIVVIPENKTIIVNSNAVASSVDIAKGAVLKVEEGAKLVVGDGGISLVKRAGEDSPSKIEVAATGLIIVGANGIFHSDASASDYDQILLDASKETSGQILLNPDCKRNQNPKATVKMVANIGLSGTSHKWHRLAIPVNGLAEAWTKDPSIGTYLYEWDYAAGDWVKTEGGSTAMKPFVGYTITTKEEIQDITYSYKGNLLGISDSNIPFSFDKPGYGYYGNSYTGYIYTKELLEQLFDVEGAQGTVWTWNAAGQCFSYASKADFEEDFEDLPACVKEIAPMQTFIFRRDEAGKDTLNVDYASAIWGNPRYGLVEPTAAPAREAAAKTDNTAKFVVKIATATCYDQVKMVENEERSDYFENGYDVTKLENPAPTFNLYAVVNDTNYSNVYSNTLNGKKITLAAREETAYTLSIEGTVVGTKYAIRDLSNGEIITIEKDNTYEFTATANTTVERFEIFDNSTSLKEVRSKANAVKMMVDGQMVIVREGQMFNAQGARL